MCDKLQSTGNLKLPPNTKLPFFSYGIFQPGELGFLAIAPFVSTCHRSITKGELWIRDGMPILDPNDKQTKITGVTLHFAEDHAQTAYEGIASLEPGRYYRWDEALADGKAVNILYGISPTKGSKKPDPDRPWDGKDDPLFTSAIQVVQETLEKNMIFESNLKPLFHLQMAYLLLYGQQ